MRIRAVRLVLLLMASLWGQATPGTGSIRGNVLDLSHSVIAGAQVTLFDTQRETSRELSTNSAGSFLFPDIPPGFYTLRVSRRDFKTSEMSGIRIDVGQTAGAEIVLSPGDIRTVVTVSAEQQVLLDKESDTIGTVIDSARVASLPLNGRNLLQLSLLAGGTNEFGRRSSAIPVLVGYASRGVILGGAQSYMSGYLINGISVRGSRLGELAVDVSVAAVDEFKIQESSFPLDQGPNPGLVNVATKGGTNRFHGESFYYLRNQVLDARNFFARTPEDLKRNQFGAAAGGPVRRNRAWFFAHYEGLRESNAAAATAFTPTQAMFTGDFRQLGQQIFDPDSFSGATGQRQPFPGSVIPVARINPVSQNLLAYYLPGSSISQRPANRFGNSVRQLNQDQGGARVDVALASGQTLFGQYIEAQNLAQQGSLFPLAGTSYPNQSRFGMMQHTWVITPRLIGTARLGYLGSQALLNNEARDLGPLLTKIGIQNAFDDRGISGVNFQNFTAFGQSTGDVGNKDHNYQLDYGLHYLRGRHDLQFGADIRYLRTSTQNANTTALGSVFFQPNYTAQSQLVSGGFGIQSGTGSDFADFLLGTPSSGQMAGLPRLDYRMTQYMPYVQDTWKIRQDFSLNYGLGWYFGTVPDPRGLAREGAHGFDRSTGLLTYAALGQLDPRVMRADRNNLAPRLGIAWSPRFLPRTVIRAGGGVYFSSAALIGLQAATLAPPFSRLVSLATDPLNPIPAFRFGHNFYPPAPPFQVYPGFAESVPSGTSAQFLDPAGLTPYSQQWNVAIQHSPFRRAVIELAYVGSASHRLLNNYDTAQCRPDPDNRCRPVTRPYPRYLGLLTVETNGNSSYEAGIARFSYTSASALNLRAEYTLAKALTDSWEVGVVADSQIATCRSCDKGPASFDQRHRLVISAIYPVPVARSMMSSVLTRTILDGWQINAITTFSTGSPSELVATNTTPSAFILHRPNRTCDGRDENLSGNLRTNGFVYFDPSCFASPASGYFGNAGRNITGSPGVDNWDVGLTKQFAVSEGLRAELRAEFFNAFNHVQFGQPNRFVGPNLGRISSARPPRLIQLGLRLRW